MNIFITSLFILFMSSYGFSQDEYFKLPQAKTQKPTFIFNEKIIGNEFLVKSLGSSKQELNEKIKGISVLHGKPNREQSDYYNLTEQGIVFVDLKENPSSKTQSELNEFFGLDKQNEIYIDGYLLESKKYSIILSGITEIELVEPDKANNLNNRVLNIWTLTKSERYVQNKN